jgi:hypothetical protein
MCQHGDSCPYIYAEADCVSECEAGVEEAKLLGGTCPEAIDELIDCHTRLTCEELTRRATGGYYNDDCVAKEQAVQQCIPGESTSSEVVEDELSLACAAICGAIDDCPTTFAEPNCVDVCLTGYRRAKNGSPSCTDAVIETINCQAAMNCEEIENRVLNRSSDDSCRDTDRLAEGACAR